MNFRKPVTTTYAANDLNQYKHEGTVSGAIDHQFDDDGNLENDGVWTYEWNAENRLYAMEKINKVDGAKRLEFKYDFMGRRYQKDVFVYASGNFPVNPNTTTTFIYDGWNLIHEKVADNTTSTSDTRSYVWGLDLSQTLQGAGGVGGLLCTVHKPYGVSSSAYYAMADGNGNITDYVDDNGVAQAHFEYDAFGQIVNAPETQGPMPSAFHFRFSSKYQDSETDLNYYGFRYYTPEFGRWLNRDSIEENGGMNLYQICGNSTVNGVDYLGMDDVNPCDCFSILFLEYHSSVIRFVFGLTKKTDVIDGYDSGNGLNYEITKDTENCDCKEINSTEVKYTFEHYGKSWTDDSSHTFDPENPEYERWTSQRAIPRAFGQGNVHGGGDADSASTTTAEFYVKGKLCETFEFSVN